MERADEVADAEGTGALLTPPTLVDEAPVAAASEIEQSLEADSEAPGLDAVVVAEETSSSDKTV